MRMILLFSLKPDADVAGFEEWARTRQLPGIRALVSVGEFQLYRATGLLGRDGNPPHQFVGIIDVDDMEGFDRDRASDAVRRIEAELGQFADDAPLILTEALSEVR